MAVVPACSSTGSGGVRWRRRVATSSARIESAISSGVRAPMSSPAGVCTRVGVRRVEAGEHGGAALAARDQADVVDARVERRLQHRLLVAPVRRDDDGGVVGLGADVAVATRTTS